MTSWSQTLLQLEYAECQSGYNSRDKMVPDEVRHVALTFSVLTALLVFAGSLLQGHSVWWYRTVVSLVGTVGLGLLLGFLIDIESNLSCKRALRERSKEIECLLSPEPGAQLYPPLCIWRRVIPERDRYKSWEEKNLKRFLGKVLPEAEGNYFVWATRGAVLLWGIVAVLSFLFAPEILAIDP